MAMKLTSTAFTAGSPIPTRITCEGEDISPALAWQGGNRVGYGGPCPPIGRHRYFHKLYALNVVLPDVGPPTKAVLEAAMQGHVLDEAQLHGTYQKRRRV